MQVQKQAPQPSTKLLRSRINSRSLLFLGLVLSATSTAITPLVWSQSNFSSNSEPSGFRPLAQSEPSFLPVEQAFKVELSEDQEQTTLVWTIAPGYYLYKHKFELLEQNNGEAVTLTDEAKFSRGIRKHDDYFGPVEVFYHQATVGVPQAAPQADTQTEAAATTVHQRQDREIVVKYQVCADAGLCYPVQTTQLTIAQ